MKLFTIRVPLGAVVALVLPLAVVAGSTVALAVVAVRLYKPARAYLKHGAKASAAGLQTKIDLDAVATEVQREMSASMGLGGREAQDAYRATAPSDPAAPRPEPASIKTREEIENAKPSEDGTDK